MVHLPPRNSRSPVRVHLRSLGARRIGAFRRRRRRVIPARPTTASSESRVRRLATLLTLILVAAACRASAAEHKCSPGGSPATPARSICSARSMSASQTSIHCRSRSNRRSRFARTRQGNRHERQQPRAVAAAGPAARPLYRRRQAREPSIAADAGGARAGLAHRRYGRDGGDRHPRRARAPRNAAADRSPRLPAKLGRSRTS
jgi:hypothetical protein